MIKYWVELEDVLHLFKGKFPATTMNHYKAKDLDKDQLD